MKVLTIVGARPQFVKAATVSREFAKHTDVNEVIVHTGQHFDKNMSDVFFKEMKIPKPDYHFAINGLGHGAMTGQMLEKIEEVIIKEKPGWVLVYGDTNSTLAGALAASKLHIKVAHVEAGLRSYNMAMPEEQNRVLTDRISTCLFCPTKQAEDNLKREGFDALSSGISIINCGDVMYDAAMFYSKLSSRKNQLKLPDKKYCLVTCHRAENTDDPDRMCSIVNSLNEISRKMHIVFPIHPRTRKIIQKYNLTLEFEAIEPVGYFSMIELIRGSQFVLTDSGGLQKEAYFFEKPCITMREETEWVELVENKVNLLVGADRIKTIEAFNFFNKNQVDFTKGLYGTGNASKMIVNHLLSLSK